MSIIFKITRRFNEIIHSKDYWNDFPFYIEWIGNEHTIRKKLYQKLIFRKRNWMSLEEFKSNDKTSFAILCNQLDKEETYQLLAKYKTRNLNSKNISPVDKFAEAHKAYAYLVDDLQLKNYNKNYLVSAENAFLQNFFREINELYLNKSAAVQLLLKNRAVIYCYGKERYPDTEFEEYIKTLEQYQVPVVSINAKDSFRFNQDKINQFILQLKS